MERKRKPKCWWCTSGRPEWAIRANVEFKAKNCFGNCLDKPEGLPTPEELQKARRKSSDFTGKVRRTKIENARRVQRLRESLARRPE